MIMSQVGWFRAANRHFQQASNISAHDGFKAPFVGGLPRQIYPTIHPPYGHKKDDVHSRWINDLVQRRNVNIAAVAVANKNARIAWALLARSEVYRTSVPASV